MTSETSNIKQFFENQTVFITGGTGFLGKVLIEKLLRECQNIKKIYVMVRPKKGKSSKERFEEIFNFPCFEEIKSANINYLQKVSVIYGDCQEPGLGLGKQDLSSLIDEATCVIHAAANVKFEQTLEEVTNFVKATRDLLELAKQMRSLKSFIYISTFYSNCPYTHIKEEVYEPPMTAENLITLADFLDKAVLEDIAPLLLKKWPNSYTFGKAVSEYLVKSFENCFPIAIIRPAIIFSAMKEPIPGWADNFYGALGIVAGASLGVIRSLHGKWKAAAHLVPVDYVSNCTLAAAWQICKKKNSTTIYNYCGSRNNLMGWKEFQFKIEPHCWAAASEKCIWYYCFEIRENKLWHQTCIFFLHTVPAYIVDVLLFCVGKPPLAVKNYKRLNKLLESLSYFSTRHWTFENDNVEKLWDEMNKEDKNIFDFNMSKLDWNECMSSAIAGGRRFLLKDTPDTLAKGHRKLKILFVAHYTVVALFWFLLYKFIMFAWRCIF